MRGLTRDHTVPRHERNRALTPVLVVETINHMTPL
jgi:hypothetical protein